MDKTNQELLISDNTFDTINIINYNKNDILLLLLLDWLYPFIKN